MLVGQSTNIPVDENLKQLKRKAELSYSAKDYNNSAKYLSEIADLYLFQSDTLSYIDYKNKSIYSYSYLTKDTVNSLFIKLFSFYERSRLRDNNLLEALINNYLRIVSSQPSSTTLKILDSILSSKDVILTKYQKKEIIRKKILQYENIELFNQKILSLIQLLRLNQSTSLDIQIIIDIAECYFSIKEYRISNSFLFATLANPDLSESDNAIIFNHIGNNYLFLDKLDLAYNYYSKSLKIREKLPDNIIQLKVIYNNISNYYFAKGSPDSALLFLNYGVNLIKEKFGEFSKELPTSYNNIGNHFLRINLYDSALYYYDQCLQIMLNFPGHLQKNLLHTYNNIGIAHGKKGNLRTAINYLYTSLSLQSNYIKANINNNSITIVSPSDYIFTNSELSNLYYKFYSIDNHPQYIDSAITFNLEALRMSDSLIYFAPNEQSKLNINKRSRIIIERTLSYLFLKDSINSNKCADTSLIIALIDKCHNYILVENYVKSLNDRSINYFEDLATTKQEINNALKQITKIETQNERNFIALSKYYKIILDEIIMVDDPVENIKCEIIPFHSSNLLSIRSRIDEKTAILEYFKVYNTLYCLFISKEKINIHKISGTNIFNSVRNYINTINKFETNNELISYISSNLLKPIMLYEKPLERLIIIPDSTLSEFPFDVLINPKAFDVVSPCNYLLNHYDISYSFSLSYLLNRNSINNHNIAYDFIGFAPSTNHNKQMHFDNLNNQLEVSHIANLFSQKGLSAATLIGYNANIKLLSEYANKTRILHIASHSIGDGYSMIPSIMLSSTEENSTPELIRYSDLFNIKTYSELVIIASCKSNLGEYYSGEGIINLCRAFAINGAEKIIFSFFNLEDKFSRIFMDLFYGKILFNESIISALSQTKREILKMEEYQHPIFWANLNIIGV